jgi:hypothetical protein
MELVGVKPCGSWNCGKIRVWATDVLEGSGQLSAISVQPTSALGVIRTLLTLGKQGLETAGVFRLTAEG